MTSWADSSWTWKGIPVAARDTSSTEAPEMDTPCGERWVARASIPAPSSRVTSSSRRGERRTRGAGRFMAAASDRARASPSQAIHSVASQPGSDSDTARFATGSSSAGGGEGGDGARDSDRRTAFT